MSQTLHSSKCNVLLSIYAVIFNWHFRQDSDGLLIGITTSSPDVSTRQDIYQAALEAVAFQNRDVLEAMQSDSKIELTTLLTDGGMVNPIKVFVGLS